jgi:CheY-like chemotaxis protein/glycine cleavage system H lipoate-binding protein
MEVNPMKNPSTVMVVDDEEIVCTSCSRILSQEGYQVETCTSPQEGLKMVEAGGYSAVLLDLKMRDMDGLDFLGQLRKKNSDVPVIIITGYPTQDTANEANRLGISGYIPKPFTPSEILETVKRAATKAQPSVEASPATAAKPAQSWQTTGARMYFMGETYFRIGDDSTARVGAVLPRSTDGAPRTVELPKVGDMVYRGLPLAALQGETKRLIASPVTGTVVEVNSEIATSPEKLLHGPCADSWIVRIQPTQISEELPMARTRVVILASTDSAKVPAQQSMLESLGCQVLLAKTQEEATQACRANPGACVLLDGASFGNRGPEVAKSFTVNFPKAKVVVLGEPSSKNESAYRASKIFFYAVNPFEDQEITDILHNAFCPPEKPFVPDEVESKFLPSGVSRVHITNRNGKKVTLLAFGDLLLYHKGLGRQLIGKILDQAFPIETTRGVDKNSPADSFGQTKIRTESNQCDGLFVLVAKGMHKLAGCLGINADKDVLDAISPDVRRKTTLLVIEPTGKLPLELDVRTTDALADHILHQMVSK